MDMRAIKGHRGWKFPTAAQEYIKNSAGYETG